MENRTRDITTAQTGTLWFMKYTHLCTQATTLIPKEKKKPRTRTKGFVFFQRALGLVSKKPA